MTTLSEKVRQNPIKDFKVLTDINGEIVELDNECVDFVLLLNKLGYKTSGCCQGHSGKQGKQQFRIFFDESVTDEMMMTFLKETGEWLQINVAPVDKTRTLAKSIEHKRGLNGWVYKRFYYLNDKPYTQWIYEGIGASVDDCIYQARRDLEIIKYTIGGKCPNDIYQTQRKRVEKNVALINKRYIEEGVSCFK